MKQIIQFYSFLCLTFLIGTSVYAQVPTVQDCLGAIPVCQDTFIQNNAFSGTGNFAGEITYPLSCLQSGEKNDVWYTFTVQNSGLLNFSIIPNNGSDDYDWAVFDLTNHVCADIATTPIQVSCNYAGNNGGAGVTGANNGAGQQSSPAFLVTAGHRYVLNVSNYSSTQSGYILDFSASSAQIYDNIPPQVDSTNTILSCGDSTLTVYFSENIYCTSVQATDFTFAGPGGPYTVNAVSSTACTIGADYGSVYTLSFTPAISFAGAFTFSLVDTVYDLCFNVPVLPANYPLSINSLVLNTVQNNVSCFGGSNANATVTPATGVTYSWNTTPVQTTQSATGLQAGNYTVTVTPPIGCPAQTTVTITQPTALAQTNVSVTSTNCGTSNGSASVTVSGGTAPYTYQWAPSGGTNSSASGITGGAYTVTVTDQKGCTLTIPVNVPFAGMAASISSQQNVSCFGGNDGSGTVGVTIGSGTYSYQWYTNAFISIPAATAATINSLTAGTYQVIVTDIQGCIDTVPLTITQPAAALSQTNVTVNSSNCGSSNGSASVTVTGGTAPYTYQWAPSGGTASSASGITGGAYTVTVTDQKGCTLTIAVNVPFAGMTAGITSQQNVKCFGGNDGTGTVGVTVGSGTYSYQWYDNTFTTLPGATAATIINLLAGTYQVIVNDAQGCSDTVQLIITEPIAALSGPVTAVSTSCGGNNGSASVIISGGTAPYTYVWSNGGTTSSISGIAPGIYSITVTDSNGCTLSSADSVKSSFIPFVNLSGVTDVTCYGGNDGAATVSPSGGVSPYTVSWSNGSTTTTVNNFSAGVYVVTISDNAGCTATESFTINQASQLLLNTSAATTICIGDSANIAVVANGGTSPYSYLWSTGSTLNGIVVFPVNSTTYTVTVTDFIGCPSAVASIIVTVRPPLQVTIFADSTICRGSSIVVPATVTGGDGVYSYNWNNGLANTPSVSLTPVSDTTLFVLVTDNCGTPADSASVNILLADAPVVDFSYTPDEGCQPLTVTFTDSSQTIPNSSWLWAFGGGNFSTSQNPVYTYIQSGIYDVTLTVTNPFGCSKTLTKPDIINVFKRAQPDFDFDPKNPTLYNPTVQFTDRSIAATTWIWTFGDNTPGSTEQNPIHTYADTGIYVVKLVVNNVNLCIDSIEFIVHVQDEYSFYVPAAFTPDNNGRNDLFDVYFVGVKSFDIQIFNRWGALVQRVKDKKPVWDGKIGGVLAPEGVYAYKIDLVEQNGRKHQVKGHVTLVR